MTRKKQHPTIVKIETESSPPPEEESDMLNTSQIMALLEKTIPSHFSTSNNNNIEHVGSPKQSSSKQNDIYGAKPHKKTSEIWEHYKCLSEKQNVECVYCWKVLKRNDSSTKSMWGHMNAYHQDILKDGASKKKLKRGIEFPKDFNTPTQPYVKRVRGAPTSTPSITTSIPSMLGMDHKMPSQMLDSMSLAIQQLQQSGNLGDFNAAFLESLPKTSDTNEDKEDDDNHVEAASSSSSDEPIRNAETPERGSSPPRNTTSPLETNSSDMSTNNQLAALVNLASSNPMMLAMLNAAERASASPQPSTPKDANSTGIVASTSSASVKDDPSSFSLSEGHCAATLMSMAIDLDMTMSYHRRRIDIELCFESNRTAEKSGGRGKVICLTDLGKEIKITERVNNAVTDTELWTKTDFNQFHWAIRGKCQKCFNKA